MPYCKKKDKAFLAIRKYLRGSVVMPRGFALGPIEAAVRASAGSFLKQMSDAEISSTAKGTMPEWFTLDVARTAMVPIVGKTVAGTSVAAAVPHPVVEPAQPDVPSADAADEQPPQSRSSEARLRLRVKNKYLTRHRARLQGELRAQGKEVTKKSWRSLGCQQFQGLASSCPEYLSILGEVRSTPIQGSLPPRADAGQFKVELSAGTAGDDALLLQDFCAGKATPPRALKQKVAASVGNALAEGMPSLFNGLNRNAKFQLRGLLQLSG